MVKQEINRTALLNEGLLAAVEANKIEWVKLLHKGGAQLYFRDSITMRVAQALGHSDIH